VIFLDRLLFQSSGECYFRIRIQVLVVVVLTNQDEIDLEPLRSQYNRQMYNLDY
jgi:hypothetical protein